MVTELTLTKIFALAAADAINPCALAVLVLILLTILTYNPTNKKKVLFAGLAFSLAIFILYLFYGLIIIRFFQLIQAMSFIRVFLYKSLAVLAIILGILNIRDYIKYKPGSFGTEMPLFLRPKLKAIISKVTSVKGAFIAGIIVTLFLLPCTIGPYIIAGGILSALELIKTIPWLAFYNLIFILPMIIITLIVYIGFRNIEDISSWRERNIKKIHLADGIIMLLIGLAMLFGFV